MHGLPKKPDLCLVALIASELIIYSLGFRGYFNGDSAVMLHFRPQSAFQALSTLTKAQASGFFRPLSESLMPGLLFPLFKTHFAPYHAFSLLLHIAISALLYTALVRIFHNRLTAYLGALFFGVHAIGFYITSGIAFLADTSFTLFYLLALWSFLKGRHLLALCMFVLTLASKEAGITLPVMLVALTITVPRLRACWRSRVRPLLLFALVAVIYLGMYSRYLHVGSGQLTSWTRGDYILLFDHTVPRNLLRFLAWSFQIPDGWVTGSWLFAAPYSYVVYAFAFCILTFALVRAIRGDSLATMGLLGFLIAALPMLPLDHYMPHHPYLPLAGLALLVAAFFTFLQRKLPGKAFLAIAVLFCLNHIWLACEDARRDLYGSWVGQSAVICRSAAEFAKARPLDNSSVVYVINESRDDRLEFAFQEDMLIRFLTSLDKIRTRIVSDAAQVPRPLPANTVVALFRHNRVFDVTEDFTPASASGTARAPSKEISIDETGMLSWNTQEEVEVFVSMDGAAEKLLAHAPRGKVRPEWLFPGHTFRFAMREFRAPAPGPMLDWTSYRQEDSGAISLGKPGRAQPLSPAGARWIPISLSLLMGTVLVGGSVTHRRLAKSALAR